MQIGVVGAGNIGGALAAILPGAGHTVLLANSRGPESLRELVSGLGSAVEAATVERATAAQLVIVTIPLVAINDLPANLFAGRIVVDTCNYHPQRDGQFADLDSGAVASSELVARHLSESVIVKAFNTIYFVRLRNEGNCSLPLDLRLAIPIASDDQEAKTLVSQLITDLGFAPVDGGTLADSKRQEPDHPVYNNPVGPAEAQRLLAATG